MDRSINSCNGFDSYRRRRGAGAGFDRPNPTTRGPGKRHRRVGPHGPHGPPGQPRAECDGLSQTWSSGRRL